MIKYVISAWQVIPTFDSEHHAVSEWAILWRTDRLWRFAELATPLTGSQYLCGVTWRAQCMNVRWTQEMSYCSEFSMLKDALMTPQLLVRLRFP